MKNVKLKKLVFWLLVISIVLGTYSVVFAYDTVLVEILNQDKEGIIYYAEDGDGFDESDFRINTMRYTANVGYDVSKISIGELIDNENGTNRNHTDYDLKVGVNVLEYHLTGYDKAYTFTVTRDSNPDDKNDITEVQIRNSHDKSLIEYEEFTDSRDRYTVNVDNEVSSVIISMETNSLAPLTLPKKFSKGVELQTGENKFDITVLSKSGLKKTFTLIINREKSSVNSFDYFSVIKLDMKENEAGSEDVNYDSYSSNYRVDVSYDVSSIVIMFPATDVIYDNVLFNNSMDPNFKLKIGSNKIKIMLVAENGDKKNYTLNVVRSKPSTKLNSLFVNDYMCDNERSTNNLEASYNTSKIKIVATPEDKSAKITGNGSYNLKVGVNKFYITVTSADKTQKKYTIIINRSKEKKVKAIYYWVIVKE